MTTLRKFFALLVVAAPTVYAQSLTPDALRQKIRAYRVQHDATITRELADLLAIPNLASDSVNIARNADRLIEMLAARGISGRRLHSANGGPPAVFAEMRTPGATKAVVFYAHYDGQPIGDPTQWATEPWRPQLRDRQLEAGGRPIPIPAEVGKLDGEMRLYARSASDDKAPIVAMLAAIDALKAAGVQPSVNLKFFFDGEEEAGSPHVRSILEANKELLKADAWLFGDGPIHQSRRQQVLFGVRGVSGVDLTVYGPSHGLHSGHYGNWAPNPITLLANLIASMRDSDGRILIKNFYNDVAPITAAERKAISNIPSIDSAMRAETQLGGTEAKGAKLVERIMLPALNLRGFRGGNVGANASNTISTEASASIDFRLVPRQTPENIRKLVEAHIRSQGYFIVDHVPTPAERMAHAKIIKVTWEAGYPAVRASMDSPLGQAVLRATQDAVGGPIVALPTLGGSLPMYEFQDVLHAPLIVLPIVNHDNNQHSVNENIRLQNLFDGIEVYAGVLARLGSYWSVRP